MLRAGVGQVDVSPREPVFLWGYPHVERMSTGIHDPLYATALCLDNGEHRILSVAVDILYVDAPLVAECRRRIEAETGVENPCGSRMEPLPPMGWKCILPTAPVK